MFVLRKRAGFTLVELLVVITIIGILIALLLPAVQAAREAARRIQCSNHLKQLSMGILLHEESRKILPGGGEDVWFPRTMNGSAPEVAPYQAWGWAYQILPYIEQESLWMHPKDVVIAQTLMTMQFCPTRRAPVLVINPSGASPPRAANDYAANAGVSNKGTRGAGNLGAGFDAPICRRKDPTGAAKNRPGPVTISDISDGTSSTLLLGEKCLNIDWLSLYQTDDDAGWVEGWDWDTVRWGSFPPLPDWSEGSYVMANAGYLERHAAFGSSHPGMFNVAMCDGSVTSIQFTVALDVFKRLSSRNDGKPIGGNEF